MNAVDNLWVVGFENIGQAERARDEMLALQGKHFMCILDVVIVMRKPDGSFKVGQRETRPGASIAGATLLGFLAGAVLLQPLAGAAVAALVAGAATAVTSQAGIGDTFICEVRELMKPGTAAVFLLGEAADLEVVAHNIRGLGGTILKTNVDRERAKLVQTTLDAGNGAAAE